MAATDELMAAVVYIMFVIKMLAGLFFVIFGLFFVSRQKRIFFVLIGFANAVSALTNFLLMTLQYKGSGDTDTVTDSAEDYLWVGYADWIITTPMVVVDLCLLCHIENYTTFALVIIDEMMIVSGYIACIADEPYKFVWFAMGALFFCLMFGIMFFQHRVNWIVYYRSEIQGVENSGDFTLLKGGWRLYMKQLSAQLILLTLASWSIYPIIWLLTQAGEDYLSKAGGETIHILLSLISKLSFGVILTWNRNKITKKLKKVRKDKEKSFAESSASVNVSPYPFLPRQSTWNELIVSADIKSPAASP